MKNTTLLKSKYFNALLIGVILAGFSSCGSSKDSANSNDGIYGPSSKKDEIVMVKDNQAGYYQNYFSQERQEVDEIVTDIESYKSYEEGADTVYVDSEYDQGKAPWSYSDTKVTVHIGVGFGGYWGGGYPCYGWGWGYSGYGWGYPCGGWGWGYPGYGWGYPGYGWGWGWGWGGYPPYYRPYPPYYPYPPYNGRYTYGKRYASNYGRFNTANVYNSNSLSNRYYRSSDYNRRVQSRDYRSSYPSSSQYKGNYNRSSRSSNRSYQPNNRSYNKSNNRSYTPRNSSPSPRMRSSSPNMSRGSSMGRSSGRRNLSYSNIRSDQRYDRPTYAENNSSNRTFVKRSETNREPKATRVSYTRPEHTARSDQQGNYSQVKRPVGVRKTSTAGSISRSSSGNRSTYQRNSSARNAVSRSSSNAARSAVKSSSVKPATSSSGSSRSSRGGSSSPRSKQ